MPHTASKVTHDSLRAEIEGLVGQFDASIPQSLTQALQSCLTARDYHDIILLRSHLIAALASLQKVVYEAVQKRLGWPQQAREACQRIFDLIKGCPVENWDDVGKALESRFEETLKILADLRDGAVKSLQEHEYDVDNADQLERDIEELQKLKKSVLENWPWSNQALPPVDRGMVARSRAAIVRGEGESIDDLIRRLGGDPNNPGR